MTHNYQNLKKSKHIYLIWTKKKFASKREENKIHITCKIWKAAAPSLPVFETACVKIKKKMPLIMSSDN